MQDDDEGCRLCLHLRCWSDHEDDEGSTEASSQQRKQGVERLEHLLWQLLGLEGRSETRLWLYTDLGSVRGVSPKLQASLFLSLIRPMHEASGFLCRQVLRIACEKQPGRVIRLFSKDSKLIRHFFSGHDKRIRDWFEKFSTSGRRENEMGAQALAQFAFIHRDRYWKELVWQGIHGQAPATVASKPHYFLDLDVLKTVENFLDYVPEFWSSDELWDSLKAGDILSVDMEYFIEELLHQMMDGSRHVWEMLEQLFLEEEFDHLCQRLLSFLGDEKLLGFINKLSMGLAHTSVESRVVRGTCSRLAQVLGIGTQCLSLACAMLYNACASHPRQLLRLVRDGLDLEERRSLESLLAELRCPCDTEHKTLWRTRQGVNTWEVVKLLALESWSIYVLIMEHYLSDASLKALLAANMVQLRICSRDEEKNRKKDGRVWKEKKRKSKKWRKRRREEWSGEDYSSQTDVDALDDDDGHWYLSIDSFSTGLKKDEVPEWLSSFALEQWLNRVTAEQPNRKA